MATEPKNPAQAGATPKQLAAQARAQSEAAERRRENMIRVVGSVVVLLVVGGLIAIGYLSGRAKDEAAAGPVPDPDAPIPASVDPTTYGVPYGAGWTADDADALPTLEIWEDYQCPACAAVEVAAGDDIKALADDGLVKLLLRPATFLDRVNDPADAATLNSSSRAAAAWGCAIDAGRTGEYHSALFANHPASEGDGFTDQQLLDIGAQAGIEGEAQAQFAQCLADGTYLPWSANSQQAFNEAGVGGTPTGFLDGEELDASDLIDVEGLTTRITDATGQ